MAMSGGLSVATTADLNAVIGQLEDKFDAHRKWTENQITDFIMKLRNSTEKVDGLERNQSTALDSMSTDLKALRAGCVMNSQFRQQVNQIDKRFEHEREEVDHKLDQLKMGLEKDITSNISNLRLKAETLNANCIALTEKSKVIEETLIPSIRTDIEEQKAKRLSETQRLEADVERMKEICEQKISHTAAALRFYVTATATKLREELTPLTSHKELEVELEQKGGELKKLIKGVEETTSVLRGEVSKQKEYLDVNCERYTVEIGQHSKTMKVLEITMTNLQSSIATDLNDMRQECTNDVSKMKIEVTDSRSTASRSCAMNDNAIQALAAEVNPLKNFRELILERLHIEKFVNLVREWQTSTIPQVTSVSKDLDDRMKKMNMNQVKDHEILSELSRSTAEIRRHFKMFHAIATGLDGIPHPGVPDPMMPPVSEIKDTRLPPIGGGASGTPPPRPTGDAAVRHLAAASLQGSVGA